MGAFGPFIPCVQEHQAVFWWILRNGGRDHSTQPFFVRSGITVSKDVRTLAATGCIIPAGKDRIEIREGRTRRRIQLDQFFVVVNDSLEIVPGTSR